MTTNKLLAAAVLASVLGLSQNASALEAGSFFLKGEGGYSIANGDLKINNDFTNIAGPYKGNTNNMKYTPKTKNLKGFNGGIGIGYVINDCTSTDLTVSLNNYTKRNFGNEADAIGKSLKIKTLTAILNGYYNINASSSIKPYLTAGIGGGMNEASFGYVNVTGPGKTIIITPAVPAIPEKGTPNTAGYVPAIPETPAVTSTTYPNSLAPSFSNPQYPLNYSNGTPLANPLKSKKSLAVAYQAGFGVAFDMGKNVAFDIGYRIGNNIEPKFLKISTADSGTPYTPANNSTTPPTPASGTQNTYAMSLKTKIPNVKHTILAGIKFGF